MDFKRRYSRQGSTKQLCHGEDDVLSSLAQEAEARVKKKREERCAVRQQRQEEKQRMQQEREARLKQAADERRKQLEALGRKQGSTVGMALSESNLDSLGLVADLQSEYESAVEFYKRLSNDKRALLFMVDDLKDCVGDQKGLRESVAHELHQIERELHREQDELQRKARERELVLAEHKHQLMEKESKRQALQQEKGDSADEIQRAERQRQISECTAEVAALEAQLETLKQEVRDQRTAQRNTSISRSPATRKASSTRTMAVRRLSIDRDDQKAGLQRREQEAKQREMERRLNQTQDTRSQLENDLKLAKRKATDAKKIQADLEMQVATMESEIAGLLQQRKQKSSEIVDLRFEIDKLKTTLENLKPVGRRRY